MTQNSVKTESILASIPAPLRTELIGAYTNVWRNYKESRWEPAELNGGKLCEVVYCIVKGHIDGAFPSKASKPRNMVQACQELEKADPNKFSRSLRIQIPRIIMALYEVVR